MLHLLTSGWWLVCVLSGAGYVCVFVCLCADCVCPSLFLPAWMSENIITVGVCLAAVMTAALTGRSAHQALFLRVFFSDF